MASNNYSIPAILRSALATGDTLYKLSTAGWARLAIGASNTIMAVSSGLPSWQTLSALLDTIGSTRGSVLYRGVSGWSALVPVAAGKVLTDGGVGADPSWATNTGGLQMYTEAALTLTSTINGTTDTTSNIGFTPKAIFVVGRISGTNTTSVGCALNTTQTDGNQNSTGTDTSGGFGAVFGTSTETWAVTVMGGASTKATIKKITGTQGATVMVVAVG